MPRGPGVRGRGDAQVNHCNTLCIPVLGTRVWRIGKSAVSPLQFVRRLIASRTAFLRRLANFGRDCPLATYGCENLAFAAYMRGVSDHYI
jgi:hypothetical protein